MKEIEVPYCEGISKDGDPDVISTFLDTLDFKQIDTVCWPEFAYKATVSFALAHCGDCIFIKFKVLEKFVHAVHRESNSAVNRDSCVEFFISPDGGSDYYNFEFNCMGACKAGFGNKTRSKRQYLPADIVDGINRQALVRRGSKYQDGIAWELTASIGREVFCHHTIINFKGMKGSANFYKCGDDLPEPHYIAWNGIKAERPDFHRPEFFGKIKFL